MADTIKIAYLLDPFYQVQDNNGLTVPGAQIFVYQAGTSIPANTFKNFNGSLNTWPILTDTLGNATVLADISKTYDVLIKDQNGNLLMSKQNMVPGGAGEGGGSITPVEPIDQQHWIGLNGSSSAVSSDLVGTILHLPDASDEYQAFIESNRNDHIILSDGLYLVQAVIDIQQDSDSLENTIENLTVLTGVADPEDVIFERDEAGHDASNNVHSLKLSFIRHAQALENTNELFFRLVSAVNLTSAAIRRLSIVKLQTSGYGSDLGDVLTENDLTLDDQGYVTEIAEHPIACGSGTTYQAGEGIAITSGEISVKDGNGLSIGDVTKAETISLSTSKVWVTYDITTHTTTYSINDVCTLTPELLSSIENGGLNIRLSIPFSISTNYQVFAAIVKWTTEGGPAPSIQHRLVLGSELNHELPIGTNIVFDGSSVNSTHSNCTLQDIRGSLDPDIAQRVWHIGIIIVSSSIFGNTYYSAGHSFGSTYPVTPVTTATYSKLVTMHDALNVDLPVPPTSGHSEGDVLSIGSSGIQWSAPDLGFDAFDNAVTVSALPSTTDPRTLYLIPEG